MYAPFETVYPFRAHSPLSVLRRQKLGSMFIQEMDIDQVHRKKLQSVYFLLQDNRPHSEPNHPGFSPRVHGELQPVENNVQRDPPKRHRKVSSMPRIAQPVSRNGSTVIQHGR